MDGMIFVREERAEIWRDGGDLMCAIRDSIDPEALGDWTIALRSAAQISSEDGRFGFLEGEVLDALDALGETPESMAMKILGEADIDYAFYGSEYVRLSVWALVFEAGELEEEGESELRVDSDEETRAWERARSL